MTLRKFVRYALPALALLVLVVTLSMRPPRPESSRTNEAFSPAKDAAGPSKMNIQQDTPVAKAVPEPEKDEIEIPEGMRYQMADIAAAYKENMQYPEYAKPLNENDWNLLNPRAFIPREAPLKNGMSASMVLDRYIVNRGADLPVKVIIRGGQKDGNFAVGVDLSLSDKGKTRTLISLSESDGNENTSIYTGTIPAGMLKEAGPGEVTLIAGIAFAHGDQASTAAVVKVYENTATLMRLGEPYVDGADLVIPAYLDVEKPGRYRFEANLFDESGGQPISHLNSVFTLSREDNEGLVRVHAATLRAKGSPGPYLLKDINITMPPPSPGDTTGYASATAESFSIRGYDLDRYSDEAYENPQNSQRLEFLQKMAAGADS
jgi:hypothetical protein